MFTLSNVAVLALAGTTIAAPALQERGWQGGWGGWRNGGWNQGSGDLTSTVYEVATAVVTVTGTAPPTGLPDTPYVPVAAPPSTPAPEVTPTPAPAAGAFYGGGNGWGSSAAAQPSSAPAAAPASNDGSWQSVVAQYRSAAGLGALTPDSKLEANALKTCQDGNGQMVHELNAGTMGQVLAPGDIGDFFNVFFGGWLCERPSLPGIDGDCNKLAQGWDHSDGETGHADILSSTSYSKIGCAFATGIWACDVA